MMKRGSKRPNLSLSDSAPTNDSMLRSKRVMDAPSFNVHRAESSRQHLMEATHLDVKRAESAHQHVRALNTQFASWIQLQSQNHPDELWEDGLRDYLSHASHVMEKFKDVVDWLRENAAKSEGASAAGSPSDQKSLAVVSEDSCSRLNSDTNNVVVQENKSASLTSLRGSGLSSTKNSGLFLFSQPPASSSSLQGSALFNASSSSLFSTGQTLPSSSSVQSSGPLNSQSSRFFSTGQTPANASSFESSGLFGAQKSIFGNCQASLSSFANNQTPASSSSLQSSGLFSTQSSGFFTSSQTPSSSSSLQTSGLFSSQSSAFSAKNPTPAFTGIQSFTPPKVVETSGDVDEENELEQPSSPSLKKTEEKGVIVVHEVKCKVYVKPNNPEDKGWKDMGIGQLSIKCKEGTEKSTKESKPTILIRNEVGKILLNALIYPGIKMNIKKNTITSIFHTSSGSGQADGTEASKSEVVARTYLLRLKTEEETMKLAAVIKQYAPST
ncbi:uncharacterized protein M6B38_410195 [Iris pallida]|uniref:RanBD1 domain-containing protein n=1 Tax=Iris pallida TaxID=29817 RepID=A0AAX6FML5_IRIPA|nr:uncharacterized protein M6B38_410195 [Iris pallida]